MIIKKLLPLPAQPEPIEELPPVEPSVWLEQLSPGTKIIQRGAWATVSQKWDPISKGLVVVKKVPSHMFIQFRKGLQLEIEILSSCKHENIVPLLQYQVKITDPWFATPYCGPSIYEILKKRASSLSKETPHLMRQLLSGLDYLHSRNILHRDIKDQNVLVDEGHLTIIDFGMGYKEGARWYGSGCYIVSRFYRAPELSNPVYNRQNLKPDLDIYSAGVLYFQMLTGHRPIESPTHKGIVEKHRLIFQEEIEASHLTPHRERARQAVELSGGSFVILEEMMAYDHKTQKADRPSAKALLEKYFSKSS